MIINYLHDYILSGFDIITYVGVKTKSVRFVLN